MTELSLCTPSSWRMPSNPSQDCRSVCSMPKRTNDWQALIFFVKQFLSEDAEVTESRMLVHRSTGREAEVDVCIEGTVGGERVIVSVECTDRARRADVGGIDAMHGKHDSLPTNQLVLASRSGFTKEALIKANARGILTVSLQEEPEAAALRITRHLESLWLKVMKLTRPLARWILSQ
jgi:hypothetical protein